MAHRRDINHDNEMLQLPGAREEKFPNNEQ
jgi:hypothetical protein